MKAIGHILPCLLLAALALGGSDRRARAEATDPMSARLSAEKVGDAEPGLYNTIDGQSFNLSTYGDKFLLQSPDSPEIFVLTVEPVALGTKLLKYDTGATALRVSVWGGLTLYTAEAPNGVPATRQADPPATPHPAVSQPDLEAAFNDEASHFSYANNMNLHFAADADIAADPDSRAMAFDTLANTALGLERFAAAPPARQALTHHIDTVRLEAGPKPGVSLQGRTLLVSFSPQEGLSGCASSHAVAHQLGKLLSVSTPE